MPRGPVLRLLGLLAIQLGVLAAGASAFARTLLRGSLDAGALWQGMRSGGSRMDTEPVVLAVILGVALLAGAATTVGTAATLALRVAPSLHPLTVLSRLALPVVRGLVPLAAATTLSIAPTQRLAAAARAEASVVTNEVGSGAPVVREPATDQAVPAANDPVPRTRSSSPNGEAEPPRPGRPRSANRAATNHVVVPGEHLWGIAEARLRDLGVESGDPSPSSVAPYWSRVVAANRATLRSGNPNLIFPGEVVVLPALEVAS